MDENIKKSITALKKHAVKYQKNILLANNPEKIEQLQSEFATYISREMGELIAKGAIGSDIQKIQELLHSAFESLTDSPSTDLQENLESGLSDEEYDGQIFLIPVDYAMINSFETGNINKTKFLDKLLKMEHSVFHEMVELVDLIINDYDHEESIFNSELLFSASEELFIANPQPIKNTDGEYIIDGDPTSYQNESEVKKVYCTLSDISEKGFQELFDIDKVLKTDAFIGYDKNKIRDTKDEILKLISDDFEQLLSFYKNAVENRKCVIIMPF